jgi:hypothetical protein
MNLLIALLLTLSPLAAHTLPPCATDETGPEFAPCYWDASERGNGQGTSYVWTGQEVIELH